MSKLSVHRLSYCTSTGVVLVDGKEGWLREMSELLSEPNPRKVLEEIYNTTVEKGKSFNSFEEYFKRLDTPLCNSTEELAKLLNTDETLLKQWMEECMDRFLQKKGISLIPIIEGPMDNIWPLFCQNAYVSSAFKVDFSLLTILRRHMFGVIKDFVLPVSGKRGDVQRDLLFSSDYKYLNPYTQVEMIEKKTFVLVGQSPQGLSIAPNMFLIKAPQSLTDDDIKIISGTWKYIFQGRQV